MQTIKSLVALVILLAASCGQSDPCDAVRDSLARCGTDLAGAKCTADTLALAESADLDSMTCDQIESAGKSDWFAPCGENEYVCGFIFCCDYKYPITSEPEDFPNEDVLWDIIGVVDDYQQQMPVEVKQWLDSRSDDVLRQVVSRTYKQQIVELKNTAPKEMAVEVTRGLIDVPYDQFIERLPAADWGVELGGYKGGEVEVYDRDALGRPVRQIERMVLRPFSCDASFLEKFDGLKLGNQDMTKTEKIVYTPDSAKVYWRVYFSDNESTAADVGTVEFRRADSGGTLVTFHSAHRLRLMPGVNIPADITRLTLGGFFEGHIKHYRDLVLSR